MAIQRLFVRKRDAFANEAAHVLATLQQELQPCKSMNVMM